MTFVKAIQSIASRWNSKSNFSRAPLRLIDPQPHAGLEGGRPGAAGYPCRQVAFLWHYIKRRPMLHVTAVVSVLGAASFACIAQFGLKLIVDAMAEGPQHLAKVWWALAIFAGLLAGESALWRVGAWLGYRAILVDKAEAKLDLFNHLSGHCSRYFSDRLGGSLANRISGTGDAVRRFCRSRFSISSRSAPIFSPRWCCSRQWDGKSSRRSAFLSWYPAGPLPGRDTAAHRATASTLTVPPRSAGS